MSIINNAATVCKDHVQDHSRSDELKQDWLLLRGMNELRSQRHLTDVTLIVEGKRLEPCHRVVLSASSPYFRAMFTHQLAEQNKSEIEINDLDHRSLTSIVDYLYSGKILIDDENAQDLLTASSLLQIIGLYGRCSHYMQRRLTVQNAIEVYSFAKTLCCTELQNEAFSLACRRFTEVVGSENFLKLSKEDLIDFISSDKLSIENEEMVYEAVLAWLLFDISGRGKSINEVFSYVRFVLMDDNYIKNCIVNEDLIMEFPQLSAQISAVLLYKTKLQEGNCDVKSSVELKNLTQTNTEIVENTENIKEAPSKFDSDQETNTNTAQVHDQNDVKSIHKNNANFIQCPYYEVMVGDSTIPVKIPLETTIRAGMLKKDLLLFTNGRKTVIFDPILRRYFCGIKPKGPTENATGTNLTADEGKIPGVNANMPIMKNAEVYAAANGKIFLIGGEKS